MQEFASLAFARCENTTAMQRRPWVEDHWALADPARVDGPGAECYAGLVGRVRAALARLSALSARSVVVFSHGQFMKAVHWEIANASPPVTPETMLAFRAFHAAAPIANAEGFTAQWDGERWRMDQSSRALGLCYASRIQETATNSMPATGSASELGTRGPQAGPKASRMRGV